MKNVFSNWKGDLFGGLTASIIALPMGLAFGIQSGLGAEAGLYTAITLVFVASIIGGTKTLISDPTGPMTVVAAAIVTHSIATIGGGLEEALPLIIATFVLAGLFQILFGILNIAQYVKFMPYPVLSGFMGGIGVVIISIQLFPMLGLDSPRGALNIIKQLPNGIAQANSSALLLGIGTISMIYILPLLSKKIPSILVALIVFTIIPLLTGIQVPLIGEIPNGLPIFHLEFFEQFNFSSIDIILIPAITLAALGTIDTLLTSVVADKLTATKHNGSKELIGQGLGNIVAAFFGGIPGAGATMGTVTNINSGAKTPLAGIFKGVFLLMVVLYLGDYVKYIPVTVLSGILVTVGAGIVDKKGLKIISRIPKTDAAIFFITLLVTVFDNLLDAVAVGSVLSSMFFMKKMSDVLGAKSRNGFLSDFENDAHLGHGLPEKLQKEVYVEELNGPLFYGYANEFKDHTNLLSGVSVLILRMSETPFIDESGLVTLDDVITTLHQRKIELFITGIQDEVSAQLTKMEFIPICIAKDNIYSDFGSCIKYLEAQYNKKDYPFMPVSEKK